MDYIQIFKNAWNITWKNRYLWWFGFLVVISGGSGTLSFGDSYEEKDYQQFVDFISLHHQLFVIGTIAAVVIFFIFVALGFIGRGALIKSIQKNLEGKKSNFKAGFKDGKKYFWKVFLIAILTMIFSMASVLIFAAPIIFLFIDKSLIFGSILIFLAFLFLIPILFIIYFTQIFGSMYAVLGDLSVWDSLEKGYYLILKNVKSSIVLMLLLLLVNIILCILFLIVFIFLAIPFLILGGLLYLVFNTAGAIFTACFAGLAFFLLILLISSILKVFMQAILVLFFNEIAKPKEKEVVEEIETEKVEAGEVTSVPA